MVILCYKNINCNFSSLKKLPVLSRSPLEAETGSGSSDLNLGKTTPTLSLELLLRQFVIYNHMIIQV